MGRFCKHDNSCCIKVIASHSRLVYETHYKDVPNTRTINDVSYWCCPGWTQVSNRSHGCNKGEV